MLCDNCLKDVTGKDVVCKSCLEREQREGDKLAVKLARANEKIYKLKETVKQIKKALK